MSAWKKSDLHLHTSFSGWRRLHHLIDAQDCYVGPDEAFARQVQAHGRPGDVLVVLSTSGRSPNVVAAVYAANDIGMGTIGGGLKRPTTARLAASGFAVRGARR